jgi:nucleotidyltransferase substrate binding protein (TIGR01987 family)
MSVSIDTINIDSLLRAFRKFEQFRQHLSSEQEQAGAIQAFEYCYEVVWKTMKRLLAERGKVVNSPRETFREAALENMIMNLEIWFDFLRTRSLAEHTYEEENAKAVIAIFDMFSRELHLFLKAIGAQEGCVQTITFTNTLEDRLQGA